MLHSLARNSCRTSVLEIVVRIDEEAALQVMVDRLQRGDHQQGHEVKRIQPRQPQDEECPGPDRAVGNRIAIFPREDEAADGPEDHDPEAAGVVERGQQAVQWKLGLDDSGRHVTGSGKVLVVPDQHRAGGDEAKGFQAKQLLGRRCG